MKSFSLKKFLRIYRNLIVFKKKSFSWTKLIRNILLPLTVVILILYFIEISEKVIDSFAILSSVLIGLLFNFISSLTEKTKSNHLKQQAKEKLKRLILIQETYDAAFVSIFISLGILTITTLLIILKGISLNNILDVIVNISTAILSSTLIMLLYHLVLFLILLSNRLKKLLDVDIEEEKKRIEQLREYESNEWD